MSATTMMNIGTPQRCVLSPIRYTVRVPQGHLMMFADDTTLRGRMDGGQSGDMENNLAINTDMRKERRIHQQLYIWELEVERVSSFR